MNSKATALFVIAVWMLSIEIATATDAGRTLSLDEAVRSGLELHPMIRLAEHDVLGAEAVAKQIEAANYPQVSAIWQNTGGNTRVLANLSVSGSLPKPTNYLTTPGVRVDYLITDFGYTAHSVLASRALADASGKDVSTIKALVALNIKQAYLNCQKQQRFVDIQRDLLKRWQLVFAQAQGFYKKELRAKLDVETATAQMNQAELSLLRAQNDLKVSFAVLNHAMGRPTVETYELSPISLPPIAESSLDALYESALSQRPELQGNVDRIKAAEEGIKAAKALRYGNITAIGTAGYTWWSREEQPSGKEVSNPGAQLGFWGAGGTSAFPLYTGGRLDGKVDEAEARKSEVQATARQIVNDVVLQVTRAQLSSQTAEQQIRVAEERVAHAREALNLASERYKVSLGSILDLVAAIAFMTASEVGLAEARYEYQASRVALNYAVGAQP
ncbi:MAG TPA: TolC family protein [Nitrospira sp.]|jgi:outer membrane protein|nr:TolC family protein [Nitrospira sp.]